MIDHHQKNSTVYVAGTEEGIASQLDTHLESLKNTTADSKHSEKIEPYLYEFIE